MFKIISTCWDCPDQIEQTLESVRNQTCQDFEVHMVDDASTDPRQLDVLYSWLIANGGSEQWRLTTHIERRYALRNQVEGIRDMDPDPDDIIVWLDLDGDQLAHPHVLEHLKEYYAGGVEVTYGTHRPVSGNMEGYTKPIPYPDDVVARSDYRNYTLTTYCCFNHLRTMKYETFAQIPDWYYHWNTPGGGWMEAGADYAIMMAGLELARGNYLCIPEVLLLYNDLQPHPDNKHHPEVSDRANITTLNRPNVLDYLGIR